MDHVELSIATADRKIVDVTKPVTDFARTKGSGLLNVFVPHATAAIAIMELGSSSEADLLAAIERLLPRDGPYAHRHGSKGHGADHLVPVFLNTSLTIPVENGQVLLGTWQSIVFIDTNVDNPHRLLHLSFIGDGPRTDPS